MLPDYFPESSSPQLNDGGNPLGGEVSNRPGKRGLKVSQLPLLSLGQPYLTEKHYSYSKIKGLLGHTSFSKRPRSAK